MPSEGTSSFFLFRHSHSYHHNQFRKGFHFIKQWLQCVSPTSNLHFEIETGRWDNTPQNKRTCTWCNELDDEKRAMFACPAFFVHRLTLIESIPTDLSAYDDDIARLYSVVLNHTAQRPASWQKVLWNYLRYIFHVLKDAKDLFIGIKLSTTPLTVSSRRFS